ncbi:uncharacterized protein J3R85_015900 [Psidium guajava]|nr:uncharacterized protein J3R85_015900 [Psidium guajava]
MQRTGKAAMLMTPLRNFQVPMREPKKGPKARSAQMTKPPLPGNAVESSAVMRASGTLHMKGKMEKPRRATKGPAACTAGSSP